MNLVLLKTYWRKWINTYMVPVCMGIKYYAIWMLTGQTQHSRDKKNGLLNKEVNLKSEIFATLFRCV